MTTNIDSVEPSFQAELRDGTLTISGSYVDFAGERNAFCISASAITHFSDLLTSAYETLVQEHKDCLFELTVGPNRGEFYGMKGSL